MKKAIIITAFLLIATLIFGACSDNSKQNETNAPASETVKPADVEGHWFYEETEEFMEHFSEDIYFENGGSFLSKTWREKCVGKYDVVGNTITVNYDFYFNGAGSKVYMYQCSGTKIFEMVDGALKLTSDNWMTAMFAMQERYMC